jgi:L-alanine-DL-glutamate epimerase-like enolase superfamily enzyme
MYEKQQRLQQSTAESLQRVAAMRAECDEIILDVWQEIETAYAALEGEERLKKCAQYGIIYYTRPDRKKKSVTTDE